MVLVTGEIGDAGPDWAAEIPATRKTSGKTVRLGTFIRTLLWAES
jgi:hypothetical protein